MEMAPKENNANLPFQDISCDFQSEHTKIKNKIPLLRTRRFVLAIAIKCRSSMAQTDPAFT